MSELTLEALDGYQGLTLLHDTSAMRIGSFLCRKSNNPVKTKNIQELLVNARRNLMWKTVTNRF